VNSRNSRISSSLYLAPPYIWRRRSEADETLERVQRAFKSCDAQENGFIQADSLPHILATLGLEEHAAPPVRQLARSATKVARRQF